MDNFLFYNSKDGFDDNSTLSLNWDSLEHTQNLVLIENDPEQLIG
jgi:hypothetical protein